jgi:hypothetical protein
MRYFDDPDDRKTQEITECLTVLLARLLKWQVRPERRGYWKCRIISLQRVDLQDLLDASPALRRRFPHFVRGTYGDAVRLAAHETGLPRERFPAHCPYRPLDVRDWGFWPE